MEFKLQALSIYECGQRIDKEGNPHQEDWIYPALNKINNEKDRLFILCDGMGGHSAGEVASATVCEAMSKTINSALEKGKRFSEYLLLDAIDAAYNLLDKRDTNGCGRDKMGTTMALLMLHEGGATIAHIGDSRVYHIRPKSGKKEDVVFCTRDHSLVNDLIRAGELTEKEALNYPLKNVITRAMQPNLEYRHKADVITRKDIRPGDYFYMCSDGMLEQTSDDNLCFMLANNVSDEEKRNMLVRVSKNNHDNHSAHIIHILDVQPKSEKELALLSVAPLSQKKIENDKNRGNSDSYVHNTMEGTMCNKDDENNPTSEIDEETTENSKVGFVPFLESIAAETSAAFRMKQVTVSNGGGDNKLIWRIILGISIAILAICGVFFSKFQLKKETTRDVNNQKSRYERKMNNDRNSTLYLLEC